MLGPGSSSDYEDCGNGRYEKEENAENEKDSSTAAMTYGRLERPDFCLPPSSSVLNSPNHGRRRAIFLVLGILFLLIAAISAVFVIRTRTRPQHSLLQPTLAMSRTCALTRYPSLCITSLLNFPGALAAGEHDLIHISLNMTLNHVSHALYSASSITAVNMDTLTRSAYEDCMELLDDSIDQLTNSLLSLTGDSDTDNDDVVTWLSAAVTNQDTCNDGLDTVPEGYIKSQMVNYLQDLSELVSNCLAIFAAAGKNPEFSGVPIENRRRRRLMAEFPDWVRLGDRRLLQAPAMGVQADFVVSADGSGDYKTITEAVKAAPENSRRRIVIYVKAGRYMENVKVGRKKKNLMFIGDGEGNTVITASRSVADHYTTFRSATFAATGAGFIMRDMTIENTAGPYKHQAVALRVDADHSVVYHCSIYGYQDTLYVHSKRQFFRECDVYGTVDFIFGNAAVVLQNCTISVRKPLPQQKNTVTAQSRKDPNQNTGISIHDCRIVATPELEAVKLSYPTFLGRPWKMYSRVVVMLSYIGDNVDPAGWLAWNATFALDTLYYGEYMNYGPGAALGKRVTWSGYRVITLPEEAKKFTVGEFISGTSWLPSTGVAFLAGLVV